MKNLKIINQTYGLLILILLSLALYLSFIGGYGSDEDTLPMIYVFERKLTSGDFVTSRFTGNPVAEIGIGFLAYFLGSTATNIVTFLLFLLGIIFFYLSFQKKKNLQIFLLLCLSSPILFFDNLEPVDYSWAFFFYSLGLYFFKKKLFELSVVLFAFSIGVRINFFLFIIFSVLFYENENMPLSRKLIMIICIFLSGSLFYLPVWYDSKFQLYWLTAGRPIDQGILGIIARFFYKSFYAFGGLGLIFIIYNFIKNQKILKNENNLFFGTVILSNLILFLWIPAELSYLQPAIILLYYYLYSNFSTKLISIIIFINFISWIINPQFIDIKYKNNDKCAPKQAVDAEIKLSFKKGYLFEYFNSREMINCWAQGNSERSKRIRSGASLRIK
tara:strand:- start:169 stop:1332 length:1164 start_codon:yes stop_codon:yes gene_type:complete